jgi:hypothetical protein
MPIYHTGQTNRKTAACLYDFVLHKCGHDLQQVLQDGDDLDRKCKHYETEAHKHVKIAVKNAFSARNAAEKVQFICIFLGNLASCNALPG